jgi:hypothetical protein
LANPTLKVGSSAKPGATNNQHRINVIDFGNIEVFGPGGRKIC